MPLMRRCLYCGTRHRETKAICATCRADRYGGQYAKLRQQLLEVASLNEWPCHLCGGVIGYHLGPTEGGAFEADHTPDGLRPAHRRCNNESGSGRI